MADRLGQILKDTLQSIESGKEEIFNIAESTRIESERLNKELAKLQINIAEIIDEVDRQKRNEKLHRQVLAEVSRDCKRYSEREMRDAYSEAKESQANLRILQDREKQSRERRDEIERTLRQMESTIIRAEYLLSQIGMVINLLQSGIKSIELTRNSEQQQEFALGVIKAQEEERLRVAREIHDGPAQTLANIVLRLEIVSKLVDIDLKHVKTELTDLQDLVRANLQDIRRIIFNLRPMALDDLGIVPALEKYMENFKNTYAIEPELEIEGKEKRLPMLMEVAIFRLIQEGMTNVAKHAHSKNVLVELHFHDKHITTKIIDSGQGFAVDEVISSSGRDHFGLAGMKERVEMFSGQITIHSVSAQGTTIEFTLPIIGGEME